MKTLSTESQAARKRLAASLTTSLVARSEAEHLTDCLIVLTGDEFEDQDLQLNKLTAMLHLKDFIKAHADTKEYADGYEYIYKGDWL